MSLHQGVQLPAAPAYAGSGAIAVPARTGLPARRATPRPRQPVRVAERGVAGRAPRFLGTVLLLLFFGIVGLYGAVRGGQYETFVAMQGDPRDLVARALGMGIAEVRISGFVDLDKTEILQIAGIDPRGSLPFFDAAAARERLLAAPLVKDATVRKLYPNALSITIVERDPFALWQRDGEVFVVAADGTVIDQLRDERFARLPLVVGEGANRRVVAFGKLLESASPELRAHVRAGTLVGQRRWTLKMDNGVDVRLPEEGAAQAVARLSELQRDHRILDRDILAIDLRQPDRVVMRLGEEAASARAAELAKKPKQAKGNPT
ncbi:cell division protein FtsQ/DivIB [Alsobacter ponti]|uniref:cell division protein FtsQ/DivIB n=1 Tax=Alsobacter ponti TaxID=2962936 RepID=UPI0027D958FF|nr:cell division protein FtsQ/DivIB [Alsobacter ponti]